MIVLPAVRPASGQEMTSPLPRDDKFSSARSIIPTLQSMERECRHGQIWARSICIPP